MQSNRTKRLSFEETNINTCQCIPPLDFGRSSFRQCSHSTRIVRDQLNPVQTLKRRRSNKLDSKLSSAWVDATSKMPNKLMASGRNPHAMHPYSIITTSRVE